LETVKEFVQNGVDVNEEIAVSPLDIAQINSKS